MEAGCRYLFERSSYTCSFRLLGSNLPQSSSETAHNTLDRGTLDDQTLARIFVNLYLGSQMPIVYLDFSEHTQIYRAKVRTPKDL